MRFGIIIFGFSQINKSNLHWEHLPVALGEYADPVSGDSTMIFSGTVVVDKNNTSGLCEGKDCMVAIYTSNVHRGNQGLAQHQSLAYSIDKGRTWKRYHKNPILDIQRKDFRDPKVFWHDPTQQWIMAVVIPDLFKVQFYKSKNLLGWELMSEFGGVGDTARIWECPDIYELPVGDQGGKTKWVLSLSGSHPQGPGFVGMQYFIGQFDGKTFTADDPKQSPLYIDYGKDFYAGIVFNNLPKDDKRTIMIGWVNNWTYANQVPTSPWRGAMSIPRELSLKETNDGIRLIQKPIRNIYTLRGREIIDLTEVMAKTVEFEVEINPYEAREAGLKFLKNDQQETVIGYLPKSREVFIDRTHAGDNSAKDFASRERVKVNSVDGIIRLQIFIDNSIVEVFVNGGEQTLCDQVFPTDGNVTMERYSDTGLATFSMRAWEMKSVWRAPGRP